MATSTVTTIPTTFKVVCRDLPDWSEDTVEGALKAIYDMNPGDVPGCKLECGRCDKCRAARFSNSLANARRATRTQMRQPSLLGRLGRLTNRVFKRKQ